MSGRVELDDYTKCYLFNSENNFVGKIIEGLNEDYDNVEKCVVNKSEREYSLREKLALLNKKEMLALEGEDYLSLATYGQELFEHSSIISESLQKLVLSDSTDSSIKCINDALDEVVEEKKEQVDLPLSKLLFTLEPTERIVRKYNLEKVSEIQIPIDEELGKLFEEIRQYEDVAISIRFLALKANKLVEELQSKYKGLSDITASSDYFVASEAQTKKETIIGRIKTTQTMLSLLAKEYYSIQIAIRNHFTTINALRLCKYGIVPAIICEVAMSKGNKTESESLDNVNAIMELWGEIASVNPKMVQQNLEKLKQAVKNLSSFGKLETEVTKYLDSFNEDTELLKTEELPEEGNLDYFTVNGEKIKYPDGTPYVVRIAYECGLKLDGENQKKLDELIEKYGVPTKEEIKQGTDEEYKRAATLSLIRRPKKTPEELEALRIQLENETKQ